MVGNLSALFSNSVGYEVDHTPRDVEYSVNGIMNNLRSYSTDNGGDSNGIDFTFDSFNEDDLKGDHVTFEPTNTSATPGNLNYATDRHHQLITAEDVDGNLIFSLIVFPGDLNIYFMDSTSGSPGYQEWRDEASNSGVDFRNVTEYGFYWDDGNWVMFADGSSRRSENYNSPIESIRVNKVRATGWHTSEIEYDVIEESYR